MNGNMRTSILDTRVMRGADVSLCSDQYLVKTKIRLKLVRAEGRKNVRERFYVSKLQSEEIRRRYDIEVRNRFEALDMKKNTICIEVQQRTCWGGQRNLVVHG